MAASSQQEVELDYNDMVGATWSLPNQSKMCKNGEWLISSTRKVKKVDTVVTLGTVLEVAKPCIKFGAVFRDGAMVYGMEWSVTIK
jgi:hypothetical protein